VDILLPNSKLTWKAWSMKIHKVDSGDGSRHGLLEEEEGIGRGIGWGRSRSAVGLKLQTSMSVD
jgi:hypothetical protein